MLAERDRGPVSDLEFGLGYRLLIEAFVERGREAALSTIQLDVKRDAAANQADASGGWRIAGHRGVSSLPGLYRLALDPDRQYDAVGLRLTAEEFDLAMDEGAAFVATTGAGPTVLVVVGDGRFRLRPEVPAERTQVRIFAGSDTLAAPFSAAFVRVNFASLASHLASGTLVERPGGVDRRAFERAAGISRADMPKSFILDLGDLSDTA